MTTAKGDRPVYGFTSVPCNGRAPAMTLSTENHSLYIYHRGLIYAFERTESYAREAGKMEYDSWCKHSDDINGKEL